MYINRTAIYCTITGTHIVTSHKIHLLLLQPKKNLIQQDTYFKYRDLQALLLGEVVI